MNFWLEKRVLVAFIFSIVALAEIIDLTIVSIAIPHIMGYLSCNINQISLTITAYIVAAAIFIPLTGFMIQKVGIRNLSLFSVLFFGISSALCGFSSNLFELVLFRLLQGIGGAFLPSLAQTYIVNNFAEHDGSRNKMMMVYSLCLVMGPIIGPVLGGIIVQSLSWRWIFFVNIPICIFGFVMLLILLEKNITSNVKTDYISFIYLLLGVGSLEYFIDEGNNSSWFQSHFLLFLFVVAIIFLALFIYRGVVDKKSVVDFNLFKYRNFTISCIMIFMFMITIITAFGFFPLLLQNGYGFSVSQAGFLTVSRGLAAFIAAPIFLNLNKVIDARLSIIIALCIFGTAQYYLLGFAIQHNVYLIIGVCFLQGLGMVGLFISVMKLLYVGLPSDLNNSASGVFSFFRNIGNSVGTAISASLLSHYQQVSWHDLVAHISHYHAGYMFSSQILHNVTHSLPLISMLIRQQSFIIANLTLFKYGFFGIFFLLFMPALFISDKHYQEDE